MGRINNKANKVSKNESVNAGKSSKSVTIEMSKTVAFKTIIEACDKHDLIDIDERDAKNVTLAASKKANKDGEGAKYTMRLKDCVAAITGEYGSKAWNGKGYVISRKAWDAAEKAADADKKAKALDITKPIREQVSGKKQTTKADKDEAKTDKRKKTTKANAKAGKESGKTTRKSGKSADAKKQLLEMFTKLIAEM